MTLLDSDPCSLQASEPIHRPSAGRRSTSGCQIDHWWQTETGWCMVGNPLGIERCRRSPAQNVVGQNPARTMKTIADGQSYAMPATIGDAAVLNEIAAALAQRVTASRGNPHRDL